MTENECLAVEVMGYSIDSQVMEYIGGIPTFSTDFYFYDGKHVCAVEDWNPCVNIAHAFMLVDKMREKGWTFVLSASATGEYSSELVNGDKGSDAYGLTPAEAISAAIIKTLKEE